MNESILFDSSELDSLSDIEREICKCRKCKNDLNRQEKQLEQLEQFCKYNKSLNDNATKPLLDQLEIFYKIFIDNNNILDEKIARLSQIYEDLRLTQGSRNFLNPQSALVEINSDIQRPKLSSSDEVTINATYRSLTRTPSPASSLNDIHSNDSDITYQSNDDFNHKGHIHITRKVVRKRRRIVKKLIKINGQEKVTEEIVDEPDEVDYFETDIPTVASSCLNLNTGSNSVVNDDDKLQLQQSPLVRTRSIEDITLIDDDNNSFIDQNYQVNTKPYLEVKNASSDVVSLTDNPKGTV